MKVFLTVILILGFVGVAVAGASDTCDTAITLPKDFKGGLVHSCPVCPSVDWVKAVDVFGPTILVCLIFIGGIVCGGIAIAQGFKNEREKLRFAESMAKEGYEQVQGVGTSEMMWQKIKSKEVSA